MASLCPSYLFQNRFGVYYFRCRIPNDVRKEYHSKKTEIRKSLRTKDYRTALNCARRLWVQMDDNAFFLLPKSAPNTYVPNTSAQNDTVDTVNICTIPYTPVVIENDKQEEVVHESIKISDMVDKYCDENRFRWGVTFEYKDVRPITSILTEIVGDKECSSLSSQDIVKFKEIYIQLPKNRKKIKRYRSKSVAQLQKIEIPDQDRLSLTTIKKSFNMLITFIVWCADNHFISSELAKPLQRFNKQNLKENLEYEERDPFNDDDLKKLFEGEEYLNGTHKKPAEQWAPLIALFSACRLKEIIQLYKEDIKLDTESGIYYFDINADGDKGKTIKTKSSKRKVPVHSKLIELGFLDYVATIRTGKPIFPEIRPDNIDTVSHYISKWFGRYRKKCNVGIGRNEKKTFHSFRHSVCNYLKAKEINIDLIEEITGHINGGASQTRTRYTLPYELGIKNKTLSKLNFDSIIDFQRMKIRTVW